MSKSPWSAYGRLPSKSDGTSKADDKSPISDVVNEVMRGREQLEQYLHGALREFFEIRSGDTGYRQIIADAMTPSTRPETIEERLTRLAREAIMRREGRSPRSGAR
jgi:hypothetical protein